MKSRALALILTMAALAGFSRVEAGMSDDSTVSGSGYRITCRLAEPGAKVPAGFERDFCASLLAALKTNEGRGSTITVSLRRKAAQSFAADVRTARPGASPGQQTFSLTIMDSGIRPDMARSLAFPVLKMLQLI